MQHKCKFHKDDKKNACSKRVAGSAAERLAASSKLILQVLCILHPGLQQTTRPLCPRLFAANLVCSKPCLQQTGG
jgi:hypothetical protein